MLRPSVRKISDNENNDQLMTKEEGSWISYADLLSFYEA